MAKVFKWLVFAALALVVLLAAVTFVLHRWVRTDDFRLRAEAQASAALGVPVTLAGVAVDVWPLPAVALSGITVQSKPALTVGRVEVRPLWRPLLQGRLEVATLLVRRAVVPQQGIDALLVAAQKNKQKSAPAAPANAPVPAVVLAPGLAVESGSMDWLPRRTVLDEVTWVSTTGTRTTLEGEARLGTDGLPDQASLKLLHGPLAGLRATLSREPREASSGPNPAVPANTAAPAVAVPLATGMDQWALHIEVGGGQIDGQLGLQRTQASPRSPQELMLQGRLQTSHVEVSALTAPSQPLTGQLEALTTLEARAATTGALVEALHTQTSFTVRRAVLQGLDLVKAVQTAGLSRGGQTPLDTLAGEVRTQGRAAQLSNLVATSGLLGATGEVTVTPAKALDGRLMVTVTSDSKIVSALGGAVAVPLVVGGTLDAPEVTLSRTALLGAAIGTAVMPGVGTGVGARVGERLGEGLRGLFGKK